MLDIVLFNNIEKTMSKNSISKGDTLDKIVIFSRGDPGKLFPTDRMLVFLEQITGRTRNEINSKVQLHLFHNSSKTVEKAKMGESISVIAATELTVQRISDTFERYISKEILSVENYFLDENINKEFAIVLFYFPQDARISNEVKFSKEVQVASAIDCTMLKTTTLLRFL